MDYSNLTNPADLFSAKGLVIVITGGGTGIGLAFTHALTKNGAARVFLLGRRLAVLEAAAAATDASVVIPVQCDVTDTASVQAAAAFVAAHSPHGPDGGGYVDVLINNAGIEGPKQTDVAEASTIEELAATMTRGLTQSMAGWDAVWQTNVVAVVGLSAAFLPLLNRANARRGWAQDGGGKRETNRRDDVVAVSNGVDAGDRRSAQIITVGSISGFNRVITSSLPYTASKAGANMLGKCMATFLAPWGIRSNVIAPGRYPSEMMTDRIPELPIKAVPHGTAGTYEDMASVILYMVGKSGAYLNGSVEVNDGGRLSMMQATY